MSKYEIRPAKIHTGEIKNVIVNTETEPTTYFCGYDFMGSVDWNTNILSAYYMYIDEAEQIKKDLEAADDPAERQTRTVYIIKTHSVAKPNNRCFAGEEAFYYRGKKGYLLKATGSHIDNDRFGRWPKDYTAYALKEYGYARYCDACRAAKSLQKWADDHNDRDDYYWRETVTIIAETYAL